MMHPTFQSSDIFLNTYAKSGTTWTQFILHCLLNEADEIPEHIAHHIPVFKDPLKPKPDRKGQAKYSIYKTHCLPRKLLPESKKVYVMRNPVDVFFSYHHHNSYVLGEMRIPEDGFFRDFMLGKTVVGKWIDHVKSALENGENTLFLSYEKLHSDFEGSVRKIASFFDIQVSDERIARIKELCTFKNMSDNMENFAPEVFHVKGKFFRKGEANDYPDSFFEGKYQPLKEWYDYYKTVRV